MKHIKTVGEYTVTLTLDELKIIHALLAETSVEDVAMFDVHYKLYLSVDRLLGYDNRPAFSLMNKVLR